MFYPYFKSDPLNTLAVWAIIFYSLITLIYSLKFMEACKRLWQYYGSILLTMAASVAALLANNLILLVVFWGILGVTLYLLISLNDSAAEAAKKSFIIVAGSDSLMLFGIGIIYYLTNTMQMDSIKLELNSVQAVLAYLCLAIGCFAKAGLIPFHSWIPDYAKEAPASAAAYLPAAVDKILGVYLLVRISLNLFVMNTAMNIFLMLAGAFTIIAAVYMALIQHNMKRLLGYHSVSQVGYMVLGLGTGNPIGIAGAVFHMFNNSLYKQALFLGAGNIEFRTGTTQLDKLGGLYKVMPFTYISMLIASLSICGIIPFNGFVSKWMVYQGLITQFTSTNHALRIAAILCLIAAMFGSGLTLASFIKLLHAAFFSRPADFSFNQTNLQADKKYKEVPFSMWFPPFLLAIICIGLGVFSQKIPFEKIISPLTGNFVLAGGWYLGLAAFLIMLGLVLGLVTISFRAIKPNIRKDSSFIGTEPVGLEGAHVSGTEFYNTVKEFGILKVIYAKAENGAFDIYQQGARVARNAGRFLQYLHNGVLPTYLVWTLLGMVGLFWFLMR
jgi:formate hydrogenlyase subunit 3/multisubunit Na+/H+ antiporter MnhD subunit